MSKMFTSGYIAPRVTPWTCPGSSSLASVTSRIVSAKVSRELRRWQLPRQHALVGCYAALRLARHPRVTPLLLETRPV